MRLAIAAGVAGAVVVPSLLWIAIAQRSEPAPPISGADPAGQLAYVLGNPLEFAAVLGRTLTHTLPVYWTTFVGELGPLIVKLPPLLYWLWAAAVIASLVADGPPPRAPTGAARLWLAAAFAASIATMFAMAYLGWNPVGERVIRGVQGRYWTPAVPMLVFALPARGAALPRALRLSLFGVAVVSLAAAVGAVFGVYYRA